MTFPVPPPEAIDRLVGALRLGDAAPTWWMTPDAVVCGKIELRVGAVVVWSLDRIGEVPESHAVALLDLDAAVQDRVKGAVAEGCTVQIQAGRRGAA